MNLAEFYRENSEKAKISYRTFTNRVKSGKYKSLEDALTAEGSKGKGTKAISKKPKIEITEEKLKIGEREVGKPSGS